MANFTHFDCFWCSFLFSFDWKKIHGGIQTILTVFNSCVIEFTLIFVVYIRNCHVELWRRRSIRISDIHMPIGCHFISNAIWRPIGAQIVYNIHWFDCFRTWQPSIRRKSTSAYSISFKAHVCLLRQGDFKSKYFISTTIWLAKIAIAMIVLERKAAQLIVIDIDRWKTMYFFSWSSESIYTHENSGVFRLFWNFQGSAPITRRSCSPEWWGIKCVSH